MDWKRANDLFDIAIQLREEAREEFVQSACDDDSQLRSYVMRLLSVDGASGITTSSLLPQPTGEVEANSVVDSTVGSYRISRRIGHGGMGGVYLAHRADDAFRKTVAIKILNLGLDADRFRFERQVLAKLEHPGIARLLDGGNIADGRPFVVMEYVSGVNIDDYVCTQKLPVKQRLLLFCELCRAVEHAHKNLIVHRDLKPANVLVSDSGRVKLLDFGIAKLVGEDHTLIPVVTHSMARPMTPDYASPEQIFSEPITTQSDVYSLGVLLYKILTGVNPNSNVPLRERVENFARNPCLPLPSRSDCAANALINMSKIKRDDVDRILTKATATAIAHRYESVRDFRCDIENLINDRPVNARGPSPFYRVRKFFRRNILATCCVLALAIAALVFTLFTVRNNTALRNERDTSRFLTEVLLGALSDADPVTGSGALSVNDALEKSVLILNHGAIQSGAMAFKMRLKIGLVFLQHSRFEQAREQLFVARSLAEASKMEASDLADLNRGLAFVAMIDHNYQSACAHVAAAQHFATLAKPGQLGPEADITLSVYQARCQRGLGQVLNTKLAYATAIAQAEQLFGSNSTRYGEIVLEYASSMAGLDQQELADRLYAQAEGIIAGSVPDHQSWHFFVRGLANYRMRQGNYEGARQLFVEGYEAAARAYGPESVPAATMLGGAGSAHYRMSQYPLAEQYFQRAYNIASSSLPPGSAGVVRKSINLAQAHKAQGHYAESISVLESSIRAHQATSAALQNPDLPFYLLVLARIYSAAGDTQSAIANYRESLQLQVSIRDSADKRSEVAAAECELAALLARDPSKKLDAGALFKRCLPALEQTYGKTSKSYTAAAAIAQSAGLSP